MKIKSIKKISSNEKVYDLTMPITHTYFVGKDELLVHNCGKDYSKVDRTGLYVGRWLAKNIVAAELANKCCIQLSYAIGATHPISININCYNTNTVPIESIQEYIDGLDLNLNTVVKKFKLNDSYQISYAKIAKNGQVGDNSYPWEELNLKEDLRDI